MAYIPTVYIQKDNKLADAEHIVNQDNFLCREPLYIMANGRLYMLTKKARQNYYKEYGLRCIPWNAYQCISHIIEELEDAEHRGRLPIGKTGRTFRALSENLVFTIQGSSIINGIRIRQGYTGMTVCPD